MPIPPLLKNLTGGRFVMGSESGGPNERPMHEVLVSSFSVGIAPVSNKEYERFVLSGGNPSQFCDREEFRAAEQPVVGISWYDAVSYCEWLSSECDALYRLPTEAEREYAALGGMIGVDWPWGTSSIEEHPNFEEISSLKQPHVPSIECANGYSLQCMADNVHEWCLDWYAQDYYLSAPLKSPLGPRQGKRKVSRGGSWRHSIKFTRITARASLDPNLRYNDFGFRVYADA